MAKRSLTDQLNEVVETLIASPDSVVSSFDSSLNPLVRIAESLRNLPREEFKIRLKADLQRRTTMTTPQVNPIPAGFHGPTPYLTVKNAAKAIEFYKKALGAKEVMRLVQPDGRIGHSELKIGGAPIMLADEFPEYGILSPESLGGSPVSIHLYVEEVDVTAKRAIDAGAKELQPVSDEFYGDRAGKFADPFGHVWMIATHKEDVSADEMQNRLEALMKQEQGPVDRAKSIPEGFHTITPYLIVREAVELIDFVKQAFGAEEYIRSTGSEGGIHAEVKIGDSMFMIGGGGAWQGTPTPASIHLYVNDADAVYTRAVEAGATSMYKPIDQSYGDREAGVKDLSGNEWFIATHRETGDKPEGFRSITPYLHPKGAAGLVDFLKQAFGAEELYRTSAPDGTIAHATIKMGDSRIEMGEAHGQWQPMPMTIYMYVNDVDAVYARALAAGGKSISEPADQPYGDRNAGVQDPSGNTWYIAASKKDAH